MKSNDYRLGMLLLFVGLLRFPLLQWRLVVVVILQITTVTYFIWHPNMVALGAISSKLSLTSRDNPVRCVRGDMLSDFDS